MSPLEKDTDVIFDLIARGTASGLAEAVMNGEVDPNLCRSDGVPLINMAVMQNNTKLVAVLIACNVNVNAHDLDGQTPLMIACFRNLPDILRCYWRPRPILTFPTMKARKRYITQQPTIAAMALA
jgi:ankyrin repeat protein